MGSKAVITIIKAPKNLPHTIWEEVKGMVFSNSKVPDLYSSARLRMVMVGIRNSKIQGARLKKLPNEAYPKSSILVSGKTKRNNPLSSRKTTRAI